MPAIRTEATITVAIPEALKGRTNARFVLRQEEAGSALARMRKAEPKAHRTRAARVLSGTDKAAVFAATGLSAERDGARWHRACVVAALIWGQIDWATTRKEWALNNGGEGLVGEVIRLCGLL